MDLHITIPLVTSNNVSLPVYILDDNGGYDETVAIEVDNRNIFGL